LLKELYTGTDIVEDATDKKRLHTVILDENCAVVGHTIEALDLAGCRLQALVRAGRRDETPPLTTRLMAGDALVLFGSPAALDDGEAALIRGRTAAKPGQRAGRPEHAPVDTE
jgi:Trk K+ transport system NAD-binding subunit